MTSKTKRIWACSACGQTQGKWTGQCSACSEWNCINEEWIQKKGKSLSSSKALPLHEVSLKENPRILTGIGELDRLFGGGIVRSSLNLIGGEPGIGKSTLLMQMAHALAQRGERVLYVSGEESIVQCSLRARRLGVSAKEVYILGETDFALVQEQVDAIAPSVLIIDSIQILYDSDLSSAPGSVSQVRAVTLLCMQLAKQRSIACFLIGHVTKSGEIAGPRVLEHLVDSVFYFEGDRRQNLRMVRVVKNRFGTTDEVAVFEMLDKGLEEVKNPSQRFISHGGQDKSGCVFVPSLEGSRPILIEVQALVTKTSFSQPMRRCMGLDQNRLTLLLAVLEKLAGIPLYNCDVFVSVVGGIRVVEPALDLPMLLAVTSSFRDISIPSDRMIFGEVGLGGEVRPVTRPDLRVKEGQRMGMSSCLLPHANKELIEEPSFKGLRFFPVHTIKEAVHVCLANA